MANKVSFVYMMLADSSEQIPLSKWLVKIGMSRNIKNRIRNIQSGCPFRVSLHSSARSIVASKHEARLHKMLSEFNLRGEWFLIDDKTFDFLSDYLANIEIEYRGSIK